MPSTCIHVFANGSLFFSIVYICIGTSQVAPVVKNLPANAGDIGDSGLIPGLGRYAGGGHGNPLQCLAWRMDKKALWATVYWVTKSRTPLKRPSPHTHTCVSRLLYSSVLFIFFVRLLTNTSVISISWLL